MDVSVIIVNWNTREILRGCLNSIYENTHDISFEVIVIDNASSDGSCEMVRTEYPKVNLIANTVNRGFAAGNNQGMIQAKGRYVLLLNSDTVVLGDAIANSIRYADDHPACAVMGCQVLNKDMTVQQTCFMYPSFLNMLLSSLYLYKLMPANRFFGRERMSWWGRGSEIPVDVVTGCFMLVQRRAIEQVGLMDEQYFMYGEETDWCWRFKKAGWGVMFAPVGRIIHLGGQSARKQPGPMLLQLKGSILLFLKKNRSLLEYWGCCLLTALYFAVRLPAWAIMAIIKPAQDSTKMRCYYYAKGIFYSLRGASALCVGKEPS